MDAKTFFIVTYEWAKLFKVFVPGSPIQLSAMLEGVRPGAYLRKDHDSHINVTSH
jgi:hypothetical protein